MNPEARRRVSLAVRAGEAVADPADAGRVVEALAAGGSDLAGLHVFTFNQIEPTVRWLTEARRAAA